MLLLLKARPYQSEAMSFIHLSVDSLSPSQVHQQAPSAQLIHSKLRPSTKLLRAMAQQSAPFDYLFPRGAKLHPGSSNRSVDPRCYRIRREWSAAETFEQLDCGLRQLAVELLRHVVVMWGWEEGG